MSVDATTLGFLEKLNTDAEMQADLGATLQGAEDRTATIVSWAISRGYSIDREGLDEALKVLAAAIRNTDQLDDSELEAVAGGFNPQPEPPALVSNLANRIQPVTKTLIWG